MREVTMVLFPTPSANISVHRKPYNEHVAQRTVTNKQYAHISTHDRRRGR